MQPRERMHVAVGRTTCWPLAPGRDRNVAQRLEVRSEITAELFPFHLGAVVHSPTERVFDELRRVGNVRPHSDLCGARELDALSTV